MLSALIRPERRCAGVVAPSGDYVLNPTEIEFSPSSDHEWVTSYEARYYITEGGEVGLWDTQLLGKPTPVDGVITVSIDQSLFTPSADIVYVAYIVAISGGVESEAAVSGEFKVTA